MITILITLGICILLVIGMIIRFIYADKKQRKRWWHKWQPDYEGTDYDPIENLKDPEDVD